MESLLSRHMDVYEATKEEQLGQRSEDFMLMCFVGSSCHSPVEITGPSVN